MNMLDWDDTIMDEPQDDFITGSPENIQSHNQNVKFCMLDDPDCEACQ